MTCPSSRPSRVGLGSWARCSIRQGRPHFLGNEAHKRDLVEDPANLEREFLLLRIEEFMGLGTKFTIKELQTETTFNADMASAVQPFLPPRTSWESAEAVVALGYAVRNFTEGIYCGLRLVKVGTNKKGVVYRVERVQN